MVTTPGWIDFEGGGRDTSECVEPCLGCDGGPTEGPGDPGGGDCACIERETSTPCPDDYMMDCYDSGGLTWNDAPLTIEHFPSCAAGQDGRFANAVGSVNLVCGSAAKSGSVIYYGRQNPNAPGAAGQDPDNQTMALRNFAGVVQNDIVGAPVWGIALNVPEGVECTNFTGLVLLFDYENNRVTLGNYTNANLHEGDRPTVIDTISPIPTGINEIVLNNGTPSLGDFIIEVFLEGASSHSLSAPAQAPVGNIVGAGFFWIGNNEFGEHLIRLAWDDNTAVILRFND